MTKIEIHLVANSDYTEDALDEASIVLRNVTPTVSMNLADGTIGAAYGTPISITPRKTGKLDYEAIIPPQQKPLDFIEVSLHGTVIKVDAQVTTFDGNTRYPYDLTLTYKDVRKNPLWYVAEYNINYTPATGTDWDGGDGTFNWGTTADEGYYFAWKDAMKHFTSLGNTTADSPADITKYYAASGSKFSGWHLPILEEFYSVFPAFNQLEVARKNVWDYDSGTGTYKSSTLTAVFGYNKDTQNGISDASFWKKISNNELHAIRYLGTDYCSAWKYVWSDKMLIVSATLIGAVSNSESDAITWYNSNWNSVYFGNNENCGAVQRIFYARGSGSGSKPVVSDYLDRGYFWATCRYYDDPSLDVSAYSVGLWMSSETHAVCGFRNSNLSSFNVRLFRNGTRAKTTIETSSTGDLAVGDIVCSNGYIFAASDAVYVKQEGLTPIGIIAFVNDGTAIGDAATEKGLGRYTTKSQGRALVLCAKVIGMSGYGAQDGTDYVGNNIAMTDAKFYKGFARTVTKSNTAGTCHKMAYNYTALPAPQNSTGWFLPSAGQWKKILIHLVGISNPSAGTWYDDTAASYTTYSTNFELATAGTTYTGFGYACQTCSEYSNAHMAYIWPNVSRGVCIVTGTRATGDGANLYCRPVLAF